MFSPVYSANTTHMNFMKGGKTMEGAIRKAILKTPVEEPDELLVAIRDVCARMDNVNARFSMESDGDMIEACIYELESLRAQYRYLLRRAKSQGVTAVRYSFSKEIAEESV